MAPQPPATRSANACEQCRRRKVKCSGDQPCRTCSRQKIQCTFPFAGRGRYSDAYVQGLLATIRSQEEQIKVADGAGRASPKTQAQSTTTPSTTAAVNLEHLSPASSGPIERASGPAFEQRVRSLLQQRDTESSTTSVPCLSNVSDRPHKVTETTGTPATSTVTELLHKAPRLDLPSEADSNHLLNLFLTWLGVNQHFFDPRAFVDTMSMLFQSETSRKHTTESIWFVQYLLVMAMGKLMDFDTDVDTPHGLDYFAEAMHRMPPMHCMSDSGIIGVEILALVALNMRWRERMYEAYFNIGIAVRLALTLGCALPKEEQAQGLPSEKAHKIRVWWTVFMLDRRLSVDLGLPVAADDRQLSAELPKDSPGFPPPEAMITNIKIARTTGNIMTSLYGNASLTQLDLVQNIQSTLSSLYDIGQSMPIEYSIDLGRPFAAVTRTGGTLYLMLFQAIILCTRPIVLQRVKDKVMASSDHEALETTPVINRLCSTCKESAVKSIRILHGLRKKRLVARFGFFDLDATFSAALTLVMVGFIDGVEDITKMPAEFEQAVDVLQHLSQAVNRAAEQRLCDIRQFCSFIWPAGTASGLPVVIAGGEQADAPSSVVSSEEGRPSRPAQGVDRTSMVRAAEGMSWVTGQDDADDGGFGGERDDEEPSRIQDQNSMDYLVDFERGYNFMDLDTDADSIYLSFKDPTFPLTGVDQLDWAEMEKVFTGRPG